MKEKFVLYFSGGAMRGVFGAGVATYLEEANLYDRIEAIYASSAGAFAAAYLLSRQTRLGASIYYEDLTRDFISQKGFWLGIGQRLINKYLWHIPKESFFDALNLEQLSTVATTNKKLDVVAFGESPIRLWIKVLNVRERRVQYLSANPKNIVSLLRASSWAAPYVHTTISFEGTEYSDANAIEPIGFEEIRKRHPDNKIVIVFCGDPYLKWTSRIKSHIEGFFAEELFGNGYYDLFAGAPKHLQKDLEAIRRDSRTLFLTPEKSSPVHTRTRNSDVLRQGYIAGIEKGKEIEAFLR